MKTFIEFNEGVLDILTKKGREKRQAKKDRQAKVTRRLAGVRKPQKSREGEVKRMDDLGMKGAGQHSLSPDEKKELAGLKSKHAELVKKRAEKARSKGPR